MIAVPDGARLISCRECSRIFRVGRGVPPADYRAGKLPGRKRGRTIWVSVKRAEELYGVKL